MSKYLQLECTLANPVHSISTILFNEIKAQKGQSNSYYSDGGLPSTIDMEEFMEIQAFSVPRDGLLKGIFGGGMVFSGEMGFETYFLHAALYECAPDSIVYTYIAESDVTLMPALIGIRPNPLLSAAPYLSSIR